jgi:hypothetical protein
LSAVVAVLGLILYVPTYVAYEYFYTSLGVSPDEIGLGYATALSREITWLASYIVILCSVGALLVAAVWLAVGPARLWGILRLPRRPAAPTRRVSALTAALATAIVLEIVVFQVQSVPTVNSGIPAAPSARSFFKARADLVQVAWIDKSPQAAAVPERMLYLGQSNGVAVFWDPRDEQSVRIPTGSIVIQSFARPRQYEMKQMNDDGTVTLRAAGVETSFDPENPSSEDSEVEISLGGVRYPPEGAPARCQAAWTNAVHKVNINTWQDARVLTVFAGDFAYLFSLPNYNLLNADLLRRGLPPSRDTTSLPGPIRGEMVNAAREAASQEKVISQPC